MFQSLLPSLSVGVSSLMTLVLGVFLVMSLVFIASSKSSASPEDIAHATFCFLMKSIALLLIGTTFIPLMLTILSGQLITEHSMYAPLLVFFTGVWIFIHFNRTVQRIDAHAVAVPRAIFLYSFQFIGTIVAILAGLSLLASLFSITKISDLQWQLPVTLLLAGLLLSLSFGIHTEKKKKHHLPSLRRKK